MRRDEPIDLLSYGQLEKLLRSAQVPAPSVDSSRTAFSDASYVAAGAGGIKGTIPACIRKWADSDTYGVIRCLHTNNAFGALDVLPLESERGVGSRKKHRRPPRPYWVSGALSRASGEPCLQATPRVRWMLDR